MPLLSQMTRKYPTSSAGLTDDPVAGLQVIDPLTGNAMKLETFHEHGLPTRLLCLATQITANQKRQFFPDAGTGILPTAPAQANGLTIQLASNVLQSQNTALDPRGLLLIITSGPAVGQYRLITDVVGSFTTSQTVVVNRAWLSAEGVPVATNTYDLLVDVAWAKKFTMAAEYSLTVSTNVVSLMPVLFDTGRTGLYPTPSLRVPYSVPDQLIVLNNLAITAGAMRAPYARSRASTLETRGFFGVKLYVNDIPAGLTCDIWGSAT